MSVAVLCNLSDGVVIGVDSALTVVGSNGVEKVFEDGGKLFQLGRGLGVATYGVAGVAGRSVGSFLYEFESKHPELETQSVGEVVESLRAFFTSEYIAFAEMIHEKPFDEIEMSWNVIGLVVVGYSPGAFLSEAWEVRVPEHRESKSARLVYGPGVFGIAWFALSEPIERYLFGISIAGLMEISEWASALLGRELAPDEYNRLLSIRAGQQYPVMTDAMPIKTGIAYVRFLVDYVITHYRFAERHPTVGGKSQIGVITYKGREFQIAE